MRTLSHLDFQIRRLRELATEVEAHGDSPLVCAAYYAMLAKRLLHAAEELERHCTELTTDKVAV